LLPPTRVTGVFECGGDLNVRAAIWQAKLLLDGGAGNQHKEIRESSSRLLGTRTGTVRVEWGVCLPASLGPGATRWWQAGPASEKTGTPDRHRTVWDKDEADGKKLLKPRCARAPDVLRQLVPPRGGGNPKAAEAGSWRTTAGQLRQFTPLTGACRPKAPRPAQSRRFYVPLAVREARRAEQSAGIPG